MFPFPAPLLCKGASAAAANTPASFVGGKTVAIPGRTSSLAISLTDLTGGTDTAPQEGDMIIVAYVVSTTGPKMNGVTTAGYQRFVQALGVDTRCTNLVVDYKFAGASPDTSVTVSQTFGTSEAGAVAIYVWRGVSQVRPFESGVFASGSDGGIPDPAQITPVTNGSVILVFAGSSGPSTAPTTYTSSDLSNFVAVSQAGTNTSAAVGIGSKSWTSGAFDPATFGGGSSSTSTSWATITVALRSADADSADGSITYVGGKAVNIAPTTSSTVISLTDLLGGSGAAPIAGDMVLVAYNIGSASAQASAVETAGYTLISHLSSVDSAHTNLDMSYKIMGGTPDTSVTVSQTFNTTEAVGAVGIQVWRGVDQTTPLDVAAATASGINGSAVDPPAISPANPNALLIACGAFSVPPRAGSGLMADLDHMVNALYGNGNTIAGVSLGAGASSDPPAFSGGQSSSFASWAAATIALRPA